MIGFYDYTVVLTYLSLLSATTGIVISLAGPGHPYIGMFFLLFCGLCDAFDGRVARRKKNRSPEECYFGVQIDSLSDLVAFGVLPACIGSAMLRSSPLMQQLGEVYGWPMRKAFTYVFTAILVLYTLAALIRLAYFNVMEQKRMETEGGVRTFYTGLPVTSSSLIFPLVLLVQYITPVDVTPMYFATAIVTGFAFLSKFRIRKPGLRGILIMIGIGAIEFLFMLLGRLLK